MFKLFCSTKPVSTLVGDRRDFGLGTLFVTISPNPNTLHSVMRTNVGTRGKAKQKYSQIPQRLQYDYCMRIIERVYLPSLSPDAYLCGSCELNKRGDVHFHFIIFDKAIKNDTYLQVFRRDVYNCEETIRNFDRKSRKKVDWMNNIVFVTKPLNEVVAYCDKDHTKNVDLFNTYYTKCVTKSERVECETSVECETPTAEEEDNTDELLNRLKVLSVTLDRIAQK